MWKPVWPFVREITVIRKEIFFAIPLCTSIRSLALMGLPLTERDIAKLPTRLDELRLVFFTDNYGVQKAIVQYFKQLHGVQKFDTIFPIPFEFFEHNKDTLKSTTWQVYEGEVKTMPSIFPHLTEVALMDIGGFTITDEVLQCIFKNTGSQLLKLTLWGNLTGKITERLFPRLKELGIAGENVSMLGTIRTVEKLVVGNLSYDFKPDLVFDIMKTLSALKYLEIDDFEAQLEFGHRLKKYLQGEGRELYFNGVIVK